MCVCGGGTVCEYVCVQRDKNKSTDSKVAILGFWLSMHLKSGYRLGLGRDRFNELASLPGLGDLATLCEVR